MPITNLIGHDLRKRSGASPRLGIFGFKFESPEDHISLLEVNESIFIVLDVFLYFVALVLYYLNNGKV